MSDAKQLAEQVQEFLDRLYGMYGPSLRGPDISMLHEVVANLNTLGFYQREKDPFAPHNKQQLDDMATHIRALSEQNRVLREAISETVSKWDSSSDTFKAAAPALGIVNLRRALEEADK